MKWATVLLALPMLVCAGCASFTDWWESRTPQDKYDGAMMLYTAATVVYGQLDEEQRENVRPYKVALKAALDDIKATLDAGGEVDLSALLSAFNDALAAFNEAIDTT